MAARKKSKNLLLKYIVAALIVVIAIGCYYFLKSPPIDIKQGNFLIEVPDSSATPVSNSTRKKRFNHENSLKKEINGQKYIFETRPTGDGKYVMVAGLYSKNNGKFDKEEPEIFSLIEYISDDTVDFWLNEDEKIFITFETPGGWMSNNKTEAKIIKHIFNKNFETLTEREELFSGKLSEKYNMSFMLHSYKDNKVIVSQSDAVSCFESGVVFIIENKNAHEISEFTNGCKYEHPRFGGIVGGDLIFANVVQNAVSTGTTSTGHITQMYFVNPDTSRKSVIANFSARQNLDMYLVDLYKDEGLREDSVVLFNDSGFKLYNIQDNTLKNIEDMNEIALQY